MKNLLFILLDFTRYSMTPEFVLHIGKYLLGIVLVILALVVMYESGTYLYGAYKKRSKKVK